MTLSIIIFLIAYFFIATEKVDKTIPALLGAALVIILHQISYHDAIEKIDMNVIFLLTGMMIIVHILATTGIFEWIAIKVAQAAKGNGVLLLAMMLIVTAVLSAFLDNVTTIIIIAPVTILITQLLELPTTPFLILEALFSNIGGTGTLVGDPPNIIIGSKSHLSFNDFLFHLGPIALIIMFIVLGVFMLLLRKHFQVPEEAKSRLMQAEPHRAIINPRRLKIALPMLMLVFIGFFVSHTFHIETGIIALGGAFLMCLVTKYDVHHALLEVEWTTILFFIGLFMLVGSLEENGLFELLGEKMIHLTGGDLWLTALAILWFSAILSSFLDNIPMVISTIPIIESVIPGFAAQYGFAVESPETVLYIAEPLYWALALGACLGGNGSIIGASANVVMAQIGKQNKYPISFGKFIAYGFPTMLASVFISMIYLYLRYFLFSGIAH